MACQFRYVTSSFARSFTFALCLALALTGMPLPARTHAQQPTSATPTTPGGLRTTEAPSPNLPDLDTVRGRKETELKKPEPIPATRCRHWDKKCKTLKNEKVSGLFNRDGQNSNHSQGPQGMIAAAGGTLLGNSFDWRVSAFTFDSSAKVWNGLQPVRPMEQTKGLPKNNLTILR